MPTISPFFPSRSLSLKAGIILKRSLCSALYLTVSDGMRSSVFQLRSYPGAKRQREQFGCQSVEQALDDAITQFVRFFPGANEPISQQHSKSVHERPARQNSTSDPSFVSWGIRNGASQSPSNDDACKERLCFLCRGSFDRWAGIIRAAQVAAEHQSIERWVFDTMVDVGTQHGE
jgi:hypothetical protein